MNVTILKLLRAEARSWWANTTPEDVHKSVRSHLETLRRAVSTSDAYIHCGRGGTSLHLLNSIISWPGPVEKWETAQAAHLLGVPLIDTRTCPNPHELLSLPLCTPGREPDPEPYNWLSYVPLSVYINKAQALGATIHV